MNLDAIFGRFLWIQNEKLFSDQHAKVPVAPGLALSACRLMCTRATFIPKEDIDSKIEMTKLGGSMNGETNEPNKHIPNLKTDVTVENTALGAPSNGTATNLQEPEKNQKHTPKLLTLVIIVKGGKLLLGMKKRGFGAGYYNGFGGKVEAGETIEEAAARELEEESGVIPEAMEKRGILTFHFDDNPQPWEVHVYHVDEFVGEPYETEEMAPSWFALADIPYKSMWQDNPLWYPEFLGGRCFAGEFFFHNTHILVSHSLRVVSSGQLSPSELHGDTAR